MTFQLSKGGLLERREQNLQQDSSDRARRNEFKQKEGRFSLDMRVLKHWNWNWLPRSMADTQILETFSIRLDRTLSYLIYL